MGRGRQRKKKVTTADIYDIAIGDMKLSRWQFEQEMDYGEFTCRYLGWLRERERERDNLRHVMWASIAPHTRKRLRPQDIMKLRIDKQPLKKLDIEEYKQLRDYGKANAGS